MNVTITPAALRGTVRPPASKSQAHRLLIAAALADGESRLLGMAHSQDIGATVGCLTQLGARFYHRDGALFVTGMAAAPGCRKGLSPVCDCGESGSTLRFLSPAALVLAENGRFVGRGRLPRRPQKPYADLFAARGIDWVQDDAGLSVCGCLTSGDFALPGDVSSQFFTGLLFALPLLHGDSTLCSTTPLQSADYVTMTLDALSRAGVLPVQIGENRWHIPGGCRYRPFEAEAEADWSQAAFWYAARSAGCPVEVTGMNPDSAQGDRTILEWLEQMRDAGTVTIDLSACPDLLPPAAAAAALRQKGAVTRFENAARLRLKESDRLSTVAAALSAMGCEVQEEPAALTVVGAKTLAGGCTVDSAGDHRIAMMAAVAACGCERPVTVRGAECVAKSYPDFLQIYERLGGILARAEGEPSCAI